MSLGIDGPGFGSEGFRATYTHLRDGVMGSRFIAGGELHINTLGYIGNISKDDCLVALTLTGEACGTYIFCGLDCDADGDGNPNLQEDDWLKGYISAAMAIETGKSFIAGGVMERDVWGETFSASYAIYLVPGNWDLIEDGDGVFYKVDLVVAVVDLSPVQTL